VATVALKGPDNSVLFCASSTERAENAAGSVPEKRFILIDRMLSDGSSGMLPDMLLFATVKVVRFFILTAHERGIDPERKLFSTSPILVTYTFTIQNAGRTQEILFVLYRRVRWGAKRFSDVGMITPESPRAFSSRCSYTFLVRERMSRKSLNLHHK
jgi:hypothetical protein